MAPITYPRHGLFILAPEVLKTFPYPGKTPAQAPKLFNSILASDGTDYFGISNIILFTSYFLNQLVNFLISVINSR